MRPIEASEILDLDTYETIRDAYRARVIAHKADRRVGVGDRVTLVFEDRETLRYQIQEMTRIERLRDAAKVENEIAVYNELIPGPRELSATLFIEIPELERVKSELDRLVGIDEHVQLRVGTGDEVETIHARFAAEQMEEERISAVQYVRFSLTPSQATAFASSAAIVIDHPAYSFTTVLDAATRTSLARDLRDEPPQLLDPAAVERVSPPADEPVLAEGRVRAYRPGRRAAKEHVIVEPIMPVASLLEAEPELNAELMQVVRGLAAEIREHFGHCRVSTEIHGGPRAQLRWHLTAG